MRCRDVMSFAFTLVLVTAVVGTSVAAAPPVAPRFQDQPTSAPTSGRPVLATELANYEIRNADGDEIGGIESLLVELGASQAQAPAGEDAESQETPTATGEDDEGTGMQAQGARLSYVTFEGEEGMMAVPFGAFCINADEEVLVLDVSQEDLGDAPILDQELTEEIDSPDWDQGIRDFWEGLGFTSQEPMEDATTIRVNQMLDFDLLGQDEEVIASIDDLIVEVSTCPLVQGGQTPTPGSGTQPSSTASESQAGQVPYVVVSAGGVLGVGGTTMAVPPSLLSISQDREAFVLRVDQDALQSAPEFAADELPETATADWDQGLRAYWHGVAPELVQAPGAQASPQPDEEATPTPGTGLAGVPVRISEIGGYTLIETAGEQVATVQTLLVQLASPGAGMQEGETPTTATGTPSPTSGETAQPAAAGGVRQARLTHLIVPWSDQLLAIPPSAVCLDQEARIMVVQAERAQLDEAPSLDPSNPPDLSTPDWDAEVADWWEDLGYPSPRVENSTIYSAAQIVGYSVLDQQGDSVGEVNDLLVQMCTTATMEGAEGATPTPEDGDTTPTPGGQAVGQGQEDYGQIRYAVVGFGGFLGIGETLVLVPMEAMSLNEDQRAFTLSFDRETLENAPTFDPDQLPTEPDPEWEQGVISYWQETIPGILAPMPEMSPAPAEGTPTPEAGAAVTGTPTEEGTPTTGTPTEEAAAEVTPTPEGGAAPVVPAPGILETPPAEAVEAGRLVRARRLMGMAIVSDAEDQIAAIEDLLVEIVAAGEGTNAQMSPDQMAQIRYVTVSMGGFLGIGAQVMALPMSAVTYDPDQGVFIIQADRQALEEAPEIDETGLEDGVLTGDGAAAGWDQEISDYWSGLGFEMPQPASERHTVYRASHLIGFDVRDSEGEVIAEAGDLLVDLQSATGATGAGTQQVDQTPTPQVSQTQGTGQAQMQAGRASVTHIVVTFGGFLGIGETIVAVPVNQIRLDAEDGVWLYDGDLESLRQQPALQPSQQ